MPIDPAEPVIALERERSKDSATAQFLSVRVFPERGMNVVQIKAFLPGTGEIDLIASPPPDSASKADPFSCNQFFRMGGAILLPYANRIRGKLSGDGKTIETRIAGQTVMLPANWHGNNPGAEKHSIHGLMLESKFEIAEIAHSADESRMVATFRAGNFGGHWLSDANVKVQIALRGKNVELEVTATDAGQRSLPVGIGWHPYFALPSGDRKQVRLLIPARQRALVNNDDDVFPTGELVQVAGTPYDFTAAAGTPLEDRFFDCDFVDLERGSDGGVTCELLDPTANYGLRLIALSKEIRAMHLYAPPEKSFVALEPQFNYSDPYGEQWGTTDTGMINLEPGESVTYRVRIEMFQPS